LNTLEHGNTTLVTLDMLAQSTKSCKPSPTGRTWADVELGLMDRASEMLIQGSQRRIAAMAQVSLVATAIPGPVAGEILDIVASRATGE